MDPHIINAMAAFVYLAIVKEILIALIAIKEYNGVGMSSFAVFAILILV